MFDFRSPLTLAAAPAGLGIGAALWLAFGHGEALSRRLDSLSQRIQAARPHREKAIAVGLDPVSEALSRPLFPILGGPGAPADVSIVVQGVARSPTRTAALLAINGGVPAWIALGETRDGVTLQEVQSGKIVLDTVTGFKEVSLDDGASSGPPSSAKPAAAGAPPAPR